MKILRLSTLSMAIAVFALGYNPSFADPPPHSHGGGNNGDDPVTVTVDLNGPMAGVRGAFEFVSPAFATLDKGSLKGDEAVRMVRPGPLDVNALIDWNRVFDLCGLLGPSDAVDVPEFTASAGRKGWRVVRTGEQVFVDVSVLFQFPLDSPLSDDPLSVALDLTGNCPTPECGLIPEAGKTKEIPLNRYSIHLKGKGGVTHDAACHAADDVLNVGSTLVITAE